MFTLKRNPNVSGQAYGFQAMTPVVPAEAEALRAYLEGLRAHGRGPMARLQRTHCARWVILEDFVTDPAWGQGHVDHLPVPYLVFTSNFDGDLDSYLDELVVKLAGEAREIWGRCIGCPPGGGAELKKYLMHNQVDCGLFYAAYGEHTVAQVKAALDLRTRMIDFAVRAQSLTPDQKQAAFCKEFTG